jgi:signal transduction histidine kinase
MPQDGNLQWMSEWSAMLGALAHDIKNPLSTMSITLQLLREDWAKEKGQVALRSLQKIDVLLSESKRLEQMLASFLKDANRSAPDFQPEDINAIIEQVLEYMTPELQKKGVTATSQLDRSIPRLPLDKNLVKQAMMNLVKNAMEAIGDRGGVITLQTQSDGANAIIHVIDTGCGMSNETLQQAFSPYFSTKAQGTGLGLSSVKRIVKQHGGDVTVESALNRGTRFGIKLPLAREARD